MGPSTYGGSRPSGLSWGMNPHRRTPLLDAIGAYAMLSVAALAALPSSLPQSDPIPSNPTNPLNPSPNELPNRLPTRPAEGFKDTGPTTMPSRATERVVGDVSIATSEANHISDIASQRAAHEEVRQFAQQVYRTTQALEQELDQLALSKNVAIPTGRTSADMADDEEKWRRKDGEDFDEDYVQRSIKLHKDAIEALEDYAKDDDADGEVAAFAEKHLPVLRDHLRQAEALKRQVD
jgi:putative membrane protein